MWEMFYATEERCQELHGKCWHHNCYRKNLKNVLHIFAFNLRLIFSLNLLSRTVAVLQCCTVAVFKVFERNVSKKQSSKSWSWTRFFKLGRKVCCQVRCDTIRSVQTMTCRKIQTVELDTLSSLSSLCLLSCCKIFIQNLGSSNQFTHS